jgi:hypothetical protein
VALAHPVFFAIGLVICAIAAIPLRRHLLPRPALRERANQARRQNAGNPSSAFPFILLPSAFCLLILLGLLLIATAAGGPSISLHPPRQFTALIDLSPSTRSAAFRDRSALLHRIGELAGNIPVRLLAFSDRIQDLPIDKSLPDLPCDQTRYDPPPTHAILLFSDGRFPLPDTGPPTFPVIDPLLIDPPDAVVTRMQFAGNTPQAFIRNRGPERTLSWSGTDQTKPIIANDGSSIINGGHPNGSLIQARLNPADLWPENDSLTLPPEPPASLQFWWIGSGTPPSGWIPLHPADLPADPNAYLAAGAVALSNIPATALSATQQQCLAQYVHDLGGALLILGGDHAFAAGAYAGTELDALSPLASDPPTPTTHWILLADSSGSMAESTNGRSHWSTAVEAMLRLLPSLPPNDLVSVGSFAGDLSWWINGQPANIAAHFTTPPPNIGPNGPTNLQPVLTQIAQRTDRTPCELLLLTDADATIDDPQSLAASLKSANIRVSLLALGNVPPDNPVVRIVIATGGHWIASDDPSRWIDSLKNLMHSAAPSHLETTALTAQFVSSLDLPPHSLDSWNHTWIKKDAKPLAVAQQITLAAHWQFGIGSVAAVAFTPTNNETTAIAKTVINPPRDPRFEITWQCDSTIRISIDAADQTGYLNNLHFALNLGDAAPIPFHQSEPGRYSIELPAPRSPSLAIVLLDGHVIDRRAIPGRYAPEFDQIGNDDAALAELAARTGGTVIAPTQHTPIPFNWPVQEMRLDSYFASAGALALAVGLIGLRTSSLSRRGHAAFLTHTAASDA